MASNLHIEFKNITKRFGDFRALDNVSLDIPYGTFVTLLGPSGCGKTTLMRQLAGFSEPESGDILINGKRVNGLPPYKRNTPLVFQEYALFPHMTIFENISYGLKLKKVSGKECREKVGEMLKLFNLEGLEKRFPKQLSGGQQQRVAFARALIMGQDILLLDEPLSNLDAKLRVEVRTELRQIQQKLKITTIYVTHDQDEALSMSDIIAVMRHGKIEQIGTPWEIYFRPASRFVADFVGTVNLVEAQVLAQEGEKVTVGFYGQRMELYTGIQWSKDDRVTLAIRPESMRLESPGEAPDSGDQPRLKGEITNSSFLGRMMRYWIRAGEQTFIVDDPNPGLSGSFSGQRTLLPDAAKIHVLAEEKASC